jgi:hypothetical protein
VIADMVKANIIYNDINLKQTAIILAHHLADGKNVPENILDLDKHFASAVFSITNANRMLKMAKKQSNEMAIEIQTQKLEDAHSLADGYKGKIMDVFKQTFST